MDRPDASPRHHVSDAPVLIALTEDERLHPLDCFADEPPPGELPQRDDPETFERVPAYAGRITSPEVRRAAPARLDIRSSEVTQAQRWAAVLTAIVVVYSATTLLLMRTTAGVPIATLNERIAEAPEAAHPMPDNVAVAAVPAPAAVVAAVSPTVDEPKTTEAVATREARREASPVRLDPRIQRVSVSSPGTAEPLPIPEAPIAPLLGSPPPPVSLRVEPHLVEAPATLPRPEASAAPAPRTPPPEAAVQTVLNRYRAAYRGLDAGAALAIWPSVDTKALHKAFDRLEQQDLTFDSCQIAISDVRAVASCHGLASYVPRVGNKGVHEDPRQWEFKLSKVGEIWLIDSVSAR